jgi:hypothetical protein
VKDRKRLMVACVAASLLGVLFPVHAWGAAPDVGQCLASNEKAITARRERRLIAAQGELLVCSAESCPADIRNECVRTLESVNAALPTIVFEVKGAAGDITDVQVTMDGRRFADRCDGKAIAVDPGEHAFVFTAAGGSVERRIVIHEGEKARREPVALAPAARESPPAVTIAKHASSTWGRVAIGAGGVGVAGLILGAAAGGVASGEWTDAKRDCGKACAAGSAGQNERSTAVTWATVSTTAFVVGGGLTAAGVILWLTAPRDRETDSPPSGSVALLPSLGPGSFGARALVVLP